MDAVDCATNVVRPDLYLTSECKPAQCSLRYHMVVVLTQALLA